MTVGGKYPLLPIDQFTSFLEVYVQKIHHPTTGKESIPNFVNICANAFNVNIETLRADLGPEVVNNELRDFCRSKDIRQEFAATHTSMQNGQVERANSTIDEAIKVMLLAFGMHSRIWGEAAATYTYVHNPLPRKKLNGRSA